MSQKHSHLKNFESAKELDLQEDGWPALLAKTDIDSKIICPLLRAKRVFEEVLEATGKPANERLSVLTVIAYDQLLEAAQQEGRCVSVLEADFADLIYEPIQIDLGFSGI